MSRGGLNDDSTRRRIGAPDQTDQLHSASRAMETIASTSQSVKAGADEVEARGDSLLELSHTLRESVSGFRVDPERLH